MSVFWMSLEHVVEEGLAQSVGLALRVHVALRLELVGAVGHVVDGRVDAVELEAGDVGLVRLVVGEADDARRARRLDGRGDGAVRVLGERLAGGLVRAAEDDLLERGAGARRRGSKDEHDRLVRSADVLPVGGLAGPDVGRLVGRQVGHAGDVRAVDHDPALARDDVVDERRGVRRCELGFRGDVRVADLDGALAHLREAGAGSAALDLDLGAGAGGDVLLAGRVDEGLQGGRARCRDAAGDADSATCSGSRARTGAGACARSCGALPVLGAAALVPVLGAAALGDGVAALLHAPRARPAASASVAIRLADAINGLPPLDMRLQAQRRRPGQPRVCGRLSAR